MKEGDRLYKLLYHNKAKGDLRKLSKDVARRMLKLIEEKLTSRPDLYGERFRHSLSGYWKLKHSKYRVIYKIKGGVVEIYSLGLRDKVYENFERFLGLH